MKYAVKTVSGNERIDMITVEGDAVSYDTGKSEDIVESCSRTRGIPMAEAVREYLSGWSNGYLVIRPMSVVPEEVSAAAGADVTPSNDDQLREYWTKGEGLAKWANSPHPWTTLVRRLTKHVGRERAERIASQWFHLVFGLWPGEHKGKNPAGPG